MALGNVQQAAGTVQNMENRLTKLGLEEAQNPTVAGQLGFYSACSSLVTAVTDIAETLATARRAREAVNKIFHRTIDETV